MKTKAKKILLGLGVALLGGFSVQAQSGLEGIIVEKYYQVNAADVTNATNQGGSLAPGSVVYRVFVDVAAGWKFNQVFGNANHTWKITTTTTFFNDPVNNTIIGAQGTGTASLRNNTRLIDSYLTTGGIASGKAGILKTEDPDGTIGNIQNILANNPGGVFGAPIMGAGAQDGIATGTSGFAGANILVPNALGTSPAQDVFDNNASPGGTFSVTNGAVAALGGIVGTTTSNIVYIGQFTTDGVLGFELNVQVQNIATSAVENWVANNPQFGEFTMSALTLAPPTVSISSPANGANVITGTQMTITANASAVGAVTSVDFKVDGVSIGTDLTAPYSALYTTVAGSHIITAVATDNNSLTATSSNVVINVANNMPPTITVAAPASAVVGDVVTFTATAADADGSVTAVSFSVDGVAVGTDLSSPFNYTWTAVFGSHNVRGTATDDQGASTISALASFNVVNNIPPTAAIVSPANNAIITASTVVTVSATATDADGTVAQVVFYVNNVPQATLTSAPYTFTWTSVIGLSALTVRSTDNSGAVTASSPINVNVPNPNALPYAIGAVNQKCTQGSFCLPISAALTATVDNVIGYDIVLNYDATRVTPTGSVTVDPALINPSYVTVVNSFSNGIMNISAYLNGSAPALTEWNGNGDLFCVGFTKNVMASVDTAVYSISSLQESYYNGVIAQPASNGRYTTYKDTLFNARLRFWSGGSPLAYDLGNPNTYLITNIYGTSPSCVTNTFAPVQPDLNGQFTHNVLHGSSIDINRDILPGTNVQFAINNGDVLIARDVLLQSNTLTPSVYQMIALDVNIDGIVSAGDLSQMNQRAVLSIPEFKQAWNYNAAGTNTLGTPSKDWIFVDSTRIQSDPAYAISSTYPNNNGIGFSKALVPVTPFCLQVPLTGLLSCPSITNEVYKGIMVGDANGNFATLSSTLQLRPNGDKVVIDLANSITSGKTVDVPVSFVSSSPVQGLDFALKFNQSDLAYNGMVNYPSTSDALAYLNPDDKTLRFTATNVDLSAYSAGRPVASIRFETANGVVEPSQIDALYGILNGEVVAIEVSNRTVGINPLSADNSVSVYPNPTNGLLNITSVGDANVEMTDISGREILLQTSVKAGKTQQVNVSGFANGVYIMKISNNDFVTIKKVILNK